MEHRHRQWRQELLKQLKNQQRLWIQRLPPQKWERLPAGAITTITVIPNDKTTPTPTPTSEKGDKTVDNNKYKGNKKQDVTKKTNGYTYSDHYTTGY